MSAQHAEPKPDRLGTIRAIIEDWPAVRKHKVAGIAGDLSACLAAVVFWQTADARSGRAIMTVSKLARLPGGSRDTARRAIKVLCELGMISQAKKADGAVSKGKWNVRHLQKNE